MIASSHDKERGKTCLREIFRSIFTKFPERESKRKNRWTDTVIKGISFHSHCWMNDFSSSLISRSPLGYCINDKMLFCFPRISSNKGESFSHKNPNNSTDRSYRESKRSFIKNDLSKSLRVKYAKIWGLLMDQHILYDLGPRIEGPKIEWWPNMHKLDMITSSSDMGLVLLPDPTPLSLTTCWAQTPMDLARYQI